MSVALAALTSPEVARQAGDGVVLAVPLGATEQHGPHLPLDTDTVLATELCRAVAARCTGVLVAPAIPYGSSGEHAGFAGTLSIGQEALRALLVELVRSATDTFRGVVIVSAHGGNARPAGRAVATLRTEGRKVLLFEPRWRGDAHAGRAETSLQMYLRPQVVRSESLAAGNTRPVAELMSLMREQGVRAVSANGVLGDPVGADADEGRALFGRLLDQLCEQLNAWRSA